MARIVPVVVVPLALAGLLVAWPCAAQPAPITPPAGGSAGAVPSEAWPGTQPAPIPAPAAVPETAPTTTTEAPAPTPPVAPAAPMAAVRKSPITRRAPSPSRFAEAYRPEPDDPSGLDGVVELWGLSLLRQDDVSNPSGATPNVVVPTIGLRTWLNGRFGIDAGLGFVIDAPDARTPMIWGVAPLLGVPVALSQWRWVTAYVKPQVAASFVRFDADTRRFAVTLAALAGAELHLGWLHMPNVSLSAEMGGEFAFTGGRTPDTAGLDAKQGGPFSGYSLHAVVPPSFDNLYKNVALRIYF